MSVEKVRSSTKAEVRNTNNEGDVSGSESVIDYDPNVSQLSVSKTKSNSHVKEDISSSSGKRAFSQPMAQKLGAKNFSGIRKASTGVTMNNNNNNNQMEGGKYWFGRRSTVTGGFDLSPQVSKNSGSTNLFSDPNRILKEDWNTEFESDDLDYLNIQNNTNTQDDSTYFRQGTSRSSNKSMVINGYENEYPKPSDKIPSVTPVVNYQDKLWTQIDVLDDVQKMSEEAIENNTFFTPEYEENLKNLKYSQMVLLNSVKNMESKLDEEKKKKKSKIWFDFDIDLERIEELKYLYNKDHFDIVKGSTEDIRKNLKDMTVLMRNEYEDNDNDMIDDSDIKDFSENVQNP